ncbi:hypothetical protein Syun_009585 [Stephania yunnanensis]|uniref:Uncharacterized protein n=1 Tax=Stephania yunnanensis TaxID=152371 RepID=A0AAP0KES5_9MAGN
MARTKMTSSGEDTRVETSERAGWRAHTTFYRKSNELGWKVDDLDKESITSASNVQGREHQFIRPPFLRHNLFHQSQAKKIRNKLLRKDILLKKKAKKKIKKKMEKKVKVKEMSKKKSKNKKRKKNDDEEKDVLEQVVKERDIGKGRGSKTKAETSGQKTV